MQKETLDQFIDQLFLKLLTRHPTAEERALYSKHLSAGFDARIRPVSSSQPPATTRTREKYVSWSNHLDGEATTVRMAQEAAARAGDPPTEKLDAAWRGHMEDVLWALLNAPEWEFSP